METITERKKALEDEYGISSMHIALWLGIGWRKLNRTDNLENFFAIASAFESWWQNNQMTDKPASVLLDELVYKHPAVRKDHHIVSLRRRLVSLPFLIPPFIDSYMDMVRHHNPIPDHLPPGWTERKSQIPPGICLQPESSGILDVQRTIVDTLNSIKPGKQLAIHGIEPDYPLFRTYEAPTELAEQFRRFTSSQFHDIKLIRDRTPFDDGVDRRQKWLYLIILKRQPEIPPLEDLCKHKDSEIREMAKQLYAKLSSNKT